MIKTKYWLSVLAISVVLIAGSLAVSPIAIADDDDDDDDDNEDLQLCPPNQVVVGIDDDENIICGTVSVSTIDLSGDTPNLSTESGAQTVTIGDADDTVKVPGTLDVGSTITIDGSGPDSITSDDLLTISTSGGNLRLETTDPFGIINLVNSGSSMSMSDSGTQFKNGISIKPSGAGFSMTLEDNEIDQVHKLTFTSASPEIEVGSELTIGSSSSTIKVPGKLQIGETIIIPGTITGTVIIPANGDATTQSFFLLNAPQNFMIGFDCQDPDGCVNSEFETADAGRLYVIRNLSASVGELDISADVTRSVLLEPGDAMLYIFDGTDWQPISSP